MGENQRAADLMKRVRDDHALYTDAFHRWLEQHGVKIGNFNNATQTFTCEVDLKKLSMGTELLMLAGKLIDQEREI